MLATLQIFPPDAENQALLEEIPGLRQTPVPVIAFEGPEGHLGPESAGAVLFLHMTMVDGESAQQFYRQAALTFQAASKSAGFIRLIAFFDGFTNNVLAFWRTLDEAQAFARTRQHLDAVQDMYAKNFEYSHFAGLFQPVSPRPRHQYCDVCGHENTAPVEACGACGNALVDTFRFDPREKPDLSTPPS